MVTRWTKGLLHLLVGGACAALVAWLVFGFTQTVLNTSGPVRVTMAALVLVTLALVGWLLLAPPVRPAEVALARALLDVDLPEPIDTRSWDARWRGVIWACAVIALGGISLFALLWSLPQGVALVVQAFTDARAELVPAALADWPGGWLVLLGIVVAAAGLLVQPLLVGALQWLAPSVLGPTPDDRLAHAERQRRELLRANDLARELHDSVGHALTAIGVQAEAGARVAGADPAFAREALEEIAATTRRAVTELDDVLGALRTPTTRATTTPLDEVLAPYGPDGTASIRLALEGELDAGAGHTAYRVVQEALSNARRHGTGDPTGHVLVRDGWVEILIENALGPRRDTTGGGRGLLGMRERLALAGGTVEVGPADIAGEARWRLVARLPARQEQA